MMATPIYDHIRIYEFRLLKFQGEIFIFIFMQGYNNIKISNVRLALEVLQFWRVEGNTKNSYLIAQFVRWQLNYMCLAPT